MSENTENPRERLVDDLSNVLGEAEEMLKRAATETGDKARDLRSQVETKLLRAKLRLQEIEGEAVDRAKAAARATDDYVHDHPWHAIGVAAAIGLAVGLLLNRRGVRLAAVTDGAPRVRRGLRAAAAQLAAALLGLGRTRLELAAVDFEEARARGRANASCSSSSRGCASRSPLLAATTLVVVLLWDTHRIAALCGVTLVYALLGLVALLAPCGAEKDGCAGVRGDARRARARSRVAGEPFRGRPMSGASGTARRAERKALLAARAEFDRQRVMLAVLEIKAIVAPSSAVRSHRIGATRSPPP